VIGQKNISISIQPNNVRFINESISFSLERDYPVYLEIVVNASDGESMSYSMLTPIVKPSYRVVYYTALDSSETYVKLTLSLSDYVDKSKPIYAYVAIVNNMLLSTKNSTVVELSVPEQAYASISVDFPNRIYESGDPVNISIVFESYPSLKGTVKLYVDGNLIQEWDVEGNSTLSYVITAPQAVLHFLEDYVIKAEFVERVSTKVMATTSKILYVYNSGPSITLNSPAEGTTLSNVTTIDLSVDDPSGVASVLWKWDFEEGWHNTTEPYDITVDTLKYPNGLARLIIRAYDNKGFMSEKEFYFSIYNEEVEARVFSIWESVGNLIARYAFIPAIAVAAITMLIGFALGKWRASKPKQPIIVRIDEKLLKKRGERK